MAFNDEVLSWMTTKLGGPRYDATEVLEVTPHGYDMAGDTETGFHEEFSVDIRYLDSAKVPRWLTVDGVELESLWRFVVGVVES